MSTILEKKRQSGTVAQPPPINTDGYGGDDGSSDGSSFPISKAQVALWILMGTIVMLFGGLSSAYIVLRGVPSWENIVIPSILWLNTAILLASSATIEAARRSLSHGRLK